MGGSGIKLISTHYQKLRRILCVSAVIVVIVIVSALMNNPLAKLYSWQLSSGQLDGWTSYHLAAGLFIAKVAQWMGASDLWAVLWVLIIGIAWEIFEYFVEGTEETYGTKKKWAYNTAADIIVEVGAAAWMVW